ncbi:MAG: mechanosensitive ion channel domain-containing protein [Ginsengibacter sp.]
MKEFFNYTLFQIGEYSMKVSSIFFFITFFIVVFTLLGVFKRYIYKVKRIDLAKKYAIYSLIKYCVLVFSIIIGLQILGLNLSVLVAGSAALLVGIGLGLQNLFSDFVSGIILLVDSSVKVNDVIEVNGLICKVQEINLRTTTVLTRDDNYIILPNTDLTKNQLVNWTHNHVASRFEVTIGVDYSSDVKLVMKILKEATADQKGILATPAAFVRFTDYGESSLDFSIFFWTEEIFSADNIKSEIRIKVFELFKSNNITIPFPQRVLHIKK